MIQTHTHSDYSTLDGVCTCTQRAQRAVELGQWALALTDHGVLNGIPAHLKACRVHGLHPLLGMEAYYRPDRHVREAEWRWKRWHLILIAQDLVGWHNLIRLSSESFRSGFYQDPCVDDDLLDRHNEGVICTTSCILGPLANLIETGTEAQIEAWIDVMAMRYPGRFYIEIQSHDFDRQRLVNLELYSWAQRKGLPLIAGTDSHYAWEGYADTQKISILIGINTTVAQAAEKNKERLERGDDVYELGHEGLHMMSGEEVLERFGRFHPALPAAAAQEAVANTDALALSVQPFMLDKTLKMPRVVSSQEEAERRVREWCRETLDHLGKSGDPVYEEQLEFELDVIRSRRNFDYIYLIGVVVRWARSSDPLPVTPEDPFPAPKRPMRVGSSRGSAGGSLVCYLSRITSMDPIKHKLKFERFLNVGRKGLPDIDVDFPDDRRDEVKEFAARLIGRNRVADVAAFGRFTCRAAIGNVARMLGVDGFETKQVTDLIDPVHDEDLSKLRLSIQQLDLYAQKYPEVWRHAERLENHGDPLIFRTSKHAGGMILMPTDVNDFIPTIRASEDDPTQRTAWSETARISIVDDFGLVKADFLSITGMTQQDRILALVAGHTGQEIDLDELSVCSDPYAVEENVMQAFRDGFTLGVNQFEADAITAYIRSAQPQSLVDLAAINALYRPGPMGSGGHEHYARRRTGREQFQIEPLLEDVVGDTFGVLAFQEQVMGLFEVLADYSPSQADDVRKIISKLYREKGDTARLELEKLREQFIGPAAEKIGQEAADRRWLEVPPYSGYSFNRAHASGYSVQAYQDMWLKVNYPAFFYAVLMTLEPKKAARSIKEAAHFGMSVLGPDVNRSKAEFTVEIETNTLLYGLEAIADVGAASAAQVVEKAPYESLEHFDLAHSFKYSKCNKGHRRALLEAGALDALGGRADWSETDKAATEVKRLKIALRPGGTFGDDEELIVSCAHSQDELEALSDGEAAVVAGIIDEVKQLTTKRGRNPGQKMCRMTLRFGLDIFSVTLFPPAYAEYGFLLVKDAKVIIRGKRDDRGQVIGKSVMGIEEFVASQREQAPPQLAAA